MVMPVCSNIAIARTSLELHLTSLASSCLPAMVETLEGRVPPLPLMTGCLAALHGAAFWSQCSQDRIGPFLFCMCPSKKGHPAPSWDHLLGTQGITLKQRDSAS